MELLINFLAPMPKQIKTLEKTENFSFHNFLQMTKKMVICVDTSGLKGYSVHMKFFSILRIFGKLSQMVQNKWK